MASSFRALPLRNNTVLKSIKENNAKIIPTYCRQPFLTRAYKRHHRFQKFSRSSFD